MNDVHGNRHNRNRRDNYKGSQQQHPQGRQFRGVTAVSGCESGSSGHGASANHRYGKQVNSIPVAADYMQGSRNHTQATIVTHNHSQGQGTRLDDSVVKSRKMNNQDQRRNFAPHQNRSQQPHWMLAPAPPGTPPQQVDANKQQEVPTHTADPSQYRGLRTMNYHVPVYYQRPANYTAFQTSGTVPNAVTQNFAADAGAYRLPPRHAGAVMTVFKPHQYYPRPSTIMYTTDMLQQPNMAVPVPPTGMPQIPPQAVIPPYMQAGGSLMPSEKKLQRRRQHAIPICDPKTGKNVLEDILNEESGGSSTTLERNQSPQPPDSAMEQQTFTATSTEVPPSYSVTTDVESSELVEDVSAVLETISVDEEIETLPQFVSQLAVKDVTAPVVFDSKEFVTEHTTLANTMSENGQLTTQAVNEVTEDHLPEDNLPAAPLPTLHESVPSSVVVHDAPNLACDFEQVQQQQQPYLSEEGEPDNGIAESDTDIAEPDTDIAESDTGIAEPDTGIAELDTGIAEPDTGIETEDSLTTANVHELEEEVVEQANEATSEEPSPLSVPDRPMPNGMLSLPPDNLEEESSTFTDNNLQNQNGDSNVVDKELQQQTDIQTGDKDLSRNKENVSMSEDEEVPTPSNENPPLKLVYTADQWSPQNMEGKRIYEPQFLMQLKNAPQALKRPDSIPFDLICDTYKTQKIIIPRSLMPGTMENLPFPTFMNQSNTFSRGGGAKKASQHTRRTVIELSLNEDVQLTETENAWRPARRTGNGKDASAEEEELFKKMRSVLNKLTPEKFDKLVEQAKGFKIDTPVKLDGVIDIIFEKAVDESAFVSDYAKMCRAICKSNEEYFESEDGRNLFRCKLISKVQNEFQKTSDAQQKSDSHLKSLRQCVQEETNEEKKKELELQLEETERKYRVKYVGVIRFIGELFKRNMLRVNIMFNVLNALLKDQNEETLECVCKLITSIGKQLEIQCDQTKKPKRLEPILTKMADIVKGRQTSSRIRFMLQDVLDLKANAWEPRRDIAVPKKMEEIAKEAAQESIVQSISHTPLPPSHRGGTDSRDRERNKNQGGSDDGWKVAGRGSPATNAPLQKSKLKIADTLGTEFRLGGMNHLWSRGSSMQKNAVGYTANVVNRYTALEVESEKSEPAPSLQAKSMSESLKPTTPTASRTQPSLAEESSNQNISATKPSTETVPPVETTTSTKCANLSPDDLEKQSRLILDEFECELNCAGLVSSVEAEIPSSQYGDMIFNWFQTAFNWPDSKRKKCSDAIVALRGKVNENEIVSALSATFDDVDDLIMDIPKVYDYIAELVAPLLENNIIHFNALQKMLQDKSLMPSDTATRFMLPLVWLFIQQNKEDWVVSEWKICGLCWSAIMPNQSKVTKFLNEHCIFLECEHKGI